MSRLSFLILMVLAFFYSDSLLASASMMAPVSHGICRCYGQNPVTKSECNMELIFTFAPGIPCTVETLIPECKRLCTTQSYWVKAMTDYGQAGLAKATDRIFLERVDGYCIPNLDKRRSVKRLFTRDVIEEVPMVDGPTAEFRGFQDIPLNQEICLDPQLVQEALENTVKAGFLAAFGVALLKYIDLLGARVTPILMMPTPMLSPEIFLPGNLERGPGEPQAKGFPYEDPSCRELRDGAYCLSDQHEAEIWSEGEQVCLIVHQRG